MSLVYRLHSPGSTECSATTRGKRRSIIISSMLDTWRIDESILSACDSDFSLDINWDGCLFIASKRVHVSVLLFDFRCHAVLSLWTVQYDYEAQKTSSDVCMLAFLPALLQLSWECNINRKKCSLTSDLFVEDSVNVQLEGSAAIFVLMSTSQIKLPQANEPQSNQSPKVLFSSQMVLNIFTTVKEVETKPYCWPKMALCDG